MTDRRDNVRESANSAIIHPLSKASSELASQLAEAFRQQVECTHNFALDESPTALAIVDHHLSLSRDEEREPILSLLAAGAGAYYGELIRREIGAIWVGDGKDPGRLRLLLEHQFLYLSPIDQAFEAILGESPRENDPRSPSDRGLDPAFHLRTDPNPDAGESEGDAALSDAEWANARLAELPPLPEDQYFSLTGRFETLQLILSLLAQRRISTGGTPTTYTLEDYVSVLTSLS